MELALDDDQTTLRGTVREIIAKECSPAFVRSVIDGLAEPSRWWDTMVGLDWPALAIGEEFGGLGMTWIELAILLEELGHAIDPSPYLATSSQFVPAIWRCGDAAQRQRWLGDVAAGRITGALALGEHTVRATAVDGGWQLDGVAPYVVDASRADEIAVVATVDGGSGDDGVGVFVVDRVEAGQSVICDSIAVFDYTAHIANVSFAGAVVDRGRRLVGADIAPAVEATIDEATLGWSATTVGACQRILELVVEHVKQRHQFDVPIGSFQAVQHKAVDMYVAIERARVMAHYAALTIVEDDPRRTLAVSMAKVAAGECQDVVFRHGIQLFGGMGFTWENDLQVALRRAKLGAAMFGSTSEHSRRVARDALQLVGP